MYMNSETEALHNRLKAAGVTTHDLLFKQFPADLLLEAIASRFIDQHSMTAWECGCYTYKDMSGDEIQGYKVEFSIGWSWEMAIGPTKLETLTMLSNTTVLR